LKMLKLVTTILIFDHSVIEIIDIQ
jgi:hypothetical protein